MTLGRGTARRDARRPRRLCRARRRRLRGGVLAARRRAWRAGAEDPRARTPCDRAGLGGEPRLVDPRADRLLDRYPAAFARDRLDARGAARRSRRSGSCCARPPTSLRGQTDSMRVPSGQSRTCSRSRPSSRRSRSAPRSAESRRAGCLRATPAATCVTSWLNPTSVTVGRARGGEHRVHRGGLARRRRGSHGREDLVEAFRVRALWAAVVAGGVAFAGLIVVRQDADRLWHGLSSWPGAAAVAISAIAGVAALGLVATRRLEPARAVSVVAVAAIIAGWALAQRPELLPGLTIDAGGGAARDDDRRARRARGRLGDPRSVARPAVPDGAAWERSTRRSTRAGGSPLP